jgi:hypothetical protein
MALIRVYRFKKGGGSFVDMVENYRTVAGMGTVFALDKAKKAVLKRMQ